MKKNEYIVLRGKDGGNIVFHEKNIISVQTDGNHSKLYAKNVDGTTSTNEYTTGTKPNVMNEYEVRHRIGEIEEKFKEKGWDHVFFRVHASTIVSVRFISGFTARAARTLYIVVKSGYGILKFSYPIAQNKFQEFSHWIKGTNEGEDGDETDESED